MHPTRSRLALTRRHLLAAAATLALPLLAPAASPAADAPAASGKKVKVLYLDQSMGFRHQPVTRKTPDELASSEVAFIEYGKASGAFDVEPTQDATVLTPDKLKSIDVLAFYTTSVAGKPLPISDETWKAVLDWVSSGKGGFIGIHSATDTRQPLKGEGMDYTKFINGEFDGHPWTQGTPMRIVTHEPTHPTVSMWGPSFDYKEEIYQYQKFDPAAVRVLQSLDFEGTPLKKPYPVPVTWVREVGQGRLFYTNLGHTPSTWQDPRFKDQVTAAVKWVTHQTDGPAAPNPEAQAVWAIHSLVAYGPEGKGPAAGAPTASAVAAKLATADKAWLAETAAKVEKLRRAAPGDVNKPKAPNKADEKKDPKKYAEAVAAYEKDTADYPAKKAKYDAAKAKADADRAALVAEVLQKAGMGPAAAAAR